MPEAYPIDPRPGFYYVDVRDDAGRSFRMRGPFTSHAEAIMRLPETRDAAYVIDGRSWFMAWGTCRSETDLGPGRLNDAIALPPA